MKNLNQDTIIQRIKSDADIIETLCEFDVQEGVLNGLKNIQMVEVTTPIKSQKPLLRKLILPLVGVAALTLIVANIMLPTVINNIQNNTGIQTPLLQNGTTQVVKVDNVSVKVDRQLEKQAMKEDILYLAQVFSM